MGIGLLATMGVAQKPFREIANRYSNYNSYFSTEINKKTLNIYVQEKKPSENVKAVLNSISELKVLSFSVTDLSTVNGFISEFGKHYSLSSYSPFRVVKKGPHNQLVYLKENGEKISELIIVNTNNSKVSLIEIKGDIDLEKIAMLRQVFQFEGLESLNIVQKTPAVKQNEELFPSKSSVVVYDKTGNQIINTKSDPQLSINGYAVREDLKTTMADIHPNCIQSIHVAKQNNTSNTTNGQNGAVDIMLKGNQNELFTICEGTLYFGQNGYLQSIKIDDDCSPLLLFNCKEKPLSEIMRLEPKKVKSIQLTTNPPNCNGPLEGEYVVVEIK